MFDSRRLPCEHFQLPLHSPALRFEVTNVGTQVIERALLQGFNAHWRPTDATRSLSGSMLAAACMPFPKKMIRSKD